MIKSLGYDEVIEPLETGVGTRVDSFGGMENP